MRRRGRLVVAAAALAALVAGAGCASVTNWVSDLLERLPGLGHRNLRTHAVRSIKSVVVQRIAVMPLVPAPSPEGSVIMASAASGVCIATATSSSESTVQPPSCAMSP